MEECDLRRGQTTLDFDTAKKVSVDRQRIRQQSAGRALSLLTAGDLLPSPAVTLFSYPFHFLARFLMGALHQLITQTNKMAFYVAPVSHQAPAD